MISGAAAFSAAAAAAASPEAIASSTLRTEVRMRQRRLHARDQRLAVEQLTDRHCTVERGGIARGPGALAEICVEIGCRRDATREDAAARFQKAGLGRGEYVEAFRDAGGLARIGHVTGGVLQADDAILMR